MINEAKALKIDHGIYSSPSQWDPIMGGSGFASSLPLWVRSRYSAPCVYKHGVVLHAWCRGHAWNGCRHVWKARGRMAPLSLIMPVCVLPLQWPNYDNNPSLSADWHDFGGWKKADIKQYQGNVNLCSAGVDYNSM